MDRAMTENFKKILLAEADENYAQSLMEYIKKELMFSCIWVKEEEELSDILSKEKENIEIALVNLFLPKGEKGSGIDKVIEHDLPVIVITEDFSEELRQFLWQKKIVDYVMKEGRYNFNYLIDLIKRIHHNEEVHILIVDDSLTARLHLKRLLSVHRYQIHEAANGKEGLALLDEKKYPIKLALIDYEMPEMDGFELTRRIREEYPLNELAIIGLSAQGRADLAAKFIKHGANDFMAKPYESEQLYCRITQNIQLIEQFDELRELSLKDHLTKLFNRHYFYSVAPKFYESARRRNQIPVIAMVDIDFFKKVNDTYGHDVGDLVLMKVAATLQNFFRKSDIVVRFGGEEFVVLANNMNPKMAEYVFNKMRRKVAKEKFAINDKEFSVTVSCGVCVEDLGNIDAMLKNADQKLYKAKENGRNQVVI